MVHQIIKLKQRKTLAKIIYWVWFII